MSGGGGFVCLEGTSKALVYTLPRGVRVGCLRVVMVWFVRLLVELLINDGISSLT